MTTAFLKTALRIKSSQMSEERLRIAQKENKVFLGDKSFYFDFVFPQYATELDICESVVTPFLDRFVGGNSVTLLGYGQTDMYPRSEDQGILHQFAHLLFEKLKGADYQIYASCLELYNGNTFDLLNPNNYEENNCWKESKEKRADTPNQLLSYYKNANHETCSHHIFSVVIKKLFQNNNTVVSKFSFVYLHQIQYNQYIPYNDSKLMSLVEDNSSKNDILLLAHVDLSGDQRIIPTLDSTNKWRHRKINLNYENIHFELSQLRMDMKTLQKREGNQELEDQINMLREEMGSMRSYICKLTDELGKQRAPPVIEPPSPPPPPPEKTHSRLILQEDQPKQSRPTEKEKKDGYFVEDTKNMSNNATPGLEKNLKLSIENFSFPSCQDISSFEQLDAPVSPKSPTNLLLDDEDTLEVLAVPNWSDGSRDSIAKRTSISADSLWEDTDSSVATSCITSSAETPILAPSSDFKGDRKQNRKLLKMLHQAQADTLVKRELMGRLEKTEDFYTQMQAHYEDKMNQLRLHLTEVQRERDVALKRRSISPSMSMSIRDRPESVLQLRENKQAEELRSEYQVKVKQLITENHELRKKNTQLTQANRTSQLKANSTIQQLQKEIETLSKRNKRQSRELKMESGGAKEASALYEKELQQLKRREAAALEAKKKTEEANEAQSQLIKKRSEEIASANSQMRQLVNLLRKSANAGTFLNELNLEKILNGTFIPTPTNAPPRRSNKP